MPGRASHLHSRPFAVAARSDRDRRIRDTRLGSHDLNWHNEPVEPTVARPSAGAVTWLRVLALASGSIGAVVALLQLRHGIVPLLDTVTYWSGAESVASGHPFQTTLAPSFSNFDAVEFLTRNGRLPFVDFPVLYPLLSGSIGLVVGTRAAMHALAVLSMFVVSAAIVWGAQRSSIRPIFGVALFASLVPFLPAMRLVTQGTLSEPLFIASTLLFVVALSRYRNGGHWAPVAILVVTCSLLRFLGAPLAVLAGWEHYGRTRKLGQSAAWTVAMIVPASANIALASLNGGGHNAGWRGLDRLDLEVFIRSIGGWFDATQGDIRRTYFTADGPSWWSWPVAVGIVCLIAAGVVAVVRRRRILGDAADLALASAGILTVGLVAGMLGFDALVIADNRLMLPAGILVSSATAWTLTAKMSASKLGFAAILVSIAAWGGIAARPVDVLERFSDIDRPLPMSDVAQDLDVAVVISNDADGVHWDTGLPSAYAPMRIKPLTGEIVDDVGIYRRLPCALWRADAAVVISNETTFSTVDSGVLDELADEGRLRRITTPETTSYLATESACDD